MTAEALVCRQFLGTVASTPSADEAGDYLLGELPNRERINLYYWYYGTLAMYQLGGEHWQRWNKRCKRRFSTSKSPKATWPEAGTRNAFGAATAAASIAPPCRPFASKSTTAFCRCTMPSRAPTMRAIAETLSETS